MLLAFGIDFVPFMVFTVNIDFVSLVIVPFNPMNCGLDDCIICVSSPINSCFIMLSGVIISFSSRLVV